MAMDSDSAANGHSTANASMYQCGGASGSGGWPLGSNRLAKEEERPERERGVGGRLFSAQMSWDGQYMIGRDVGPFNAGNGGTFRRMRMDGSDAMTLDAPGGDHHDFASIPGGIAYLGKTASGECDQIFIASDAITDGEPLVDTWEIAVS